MDGRVLWYCLMWFCEVELVHREEVEADLSDVTAAATIIKSLPKYRRHCRIMTGVFSSTKVSLLLHRALFLHGSL